MRMMYEEIKRDMRRISEIRKNERACMGFGRSFWKIPWVFVLWPYTICGGVPRLGSSLYTLYV